jgi:hypothetical protein
VPCCFYKANWNAARFCKGADCAENVGQLLFESLDEDREHRAITPVVLDNVDLPCFGDGDEFRNPLNAFMDDCEDGFYTCMRRESKYPALVYLVEPAGHNHF